MGNTCATADAAKAAQPDTEKKDKKNGVLPLGKRTKTEQQEVTKITITNEAGEAAPISSNDKKQAAVPARKNSLSNSRSQSRQSGIDNDSNSISELEGFGGGGGGGDVADTGDAAVASGSRGDNDTHTSTRRKSSVSRHNMNNSNSAISTGSKLQRQDTHSRSKSKSKSVVSTASAEERRKAFKRSNTVTGVFTSNDAPSSAELEAFQKELEAQMEKSVSRKATLTHKRVDGRRQSISLPFSKRLGSPESDDAFEYLNIIGRGAFGRVVRVRHKNTGEILAMKILDKRLIRELGDQYYEMMYNERRMLNLFDHPFIARLVFDFETKNYLFLVMEFIDGGTIYAEMKRRRCLPEAQVRIWAAEMILGIEHMHERGVVFRDLKPDNVMVDRNGHARLIDMGLAAELKPGEKLKLIIGARGFKAPEMLKGYHDYSIDWWNLGVFIYQMICGKHPMERRWSNVGLDEATSQGQKIRFSNVFSKECKDFLRRLLCFDPMDRLGARGKGASEIRNHKYFEGIDWDKLRKKEIPVPHTEDNVGYARHKFTNEDAPQYANAKDLMEEFRRLAMEERERRKNRH